MYVSLIVCRAVLAKLALHLVCHILIEEPTYFVLVMLYESFCISHAICVMLISYAI